MTEREARIAFNLVSDVGYVKFCSLVEAVGGSAVKAWNAFQEKYDWQGEMPNWERELELADKHKVTIITEDEPFYPKLLRSVASPPLVLYVVGNVQALEQKGVAIVGSRRAGAYGIECAETIARGLAQANWAVFSGLAEGIDAAAHRGALLGNGITVGVLGGALDKFYPDSNRELARKMVDAGGAVISEFPFGKPPDKRTFPQRNRVVSGMARGVLALEAPLKSGTLITCHRAIEQGRPLMAIPGRVDSPLSAGTNQLLRDGLAKFVIDAQDVINCIEAVEIIEQKTLEVSKQRNDSLVAKSLLKTKRKSAKLEVNSPIQFTLEESAVLSAIPVDGEQVDVVIRSSKMSPNVVNMVLMGLSEKGAIRFLPGNRVERKFRK